MTGTISTTPAKAPIDEVDGACPLEDPVGGRRQDEEDPEEGLEDLQRHLHGGMKQLACRRNLAKAFVDCVENVVLDPRGVPGFLVDLRFRRAAQRALHLIDCAGNDHPEGECDHADQKDVVDEEAESTGDSGPREPLDSRA